MGSKKEFAVVMKQPAVVNKMRSLRNVTQFTHLQGSWVPESSLL